MSHVMRARSESFTTFSTLVSPGTDRVGQWQCLVVTAPPRAGANKEKKEPPVLNIFHYWQNFLAKQKMRAITEVFILFLNLRKNQSTLLQQNYSLDMGKCFLTNFFNPPTTTTTSRSSVILCQILLCILTNILKTELISEIVFEEIRAVKHVF